MTGHFHYNKVTDDIITSLQQIVGEKNVLYEDSEKMESYSHDETGRKEYYSMPEVVVIVESAGEISAIVKLANEKSIPLTPRGAGSGLSGGAIPIYGGILISFEKMNKILEVDKENLIAVVEPGVITNELNNYLQPEGLFFAGYPMSMETCFIGGNVAENAGGGRALKYGVTGRYVLGLEVILPTGEVARFGGKRVKDVTGYNMVQLMVGSEGTLGVYSKIYLKLLPLPKVKMDMLVLFKDVASAINVVPLIMTELSIIPTGIEFMDRLSLDIAFDFLGEKNRYEAAGAILIIEIDGNDGQQVLSECLEIGDLCTSQGALETFVAEGPREQEKIWTVRKKIGEAIMAFSDVYSVEDIVVPLNRIPHFVPMLAKLSRKYGVLLPGHGHVGDGNVHVIVIKRPEDSLEHWHEVLPKVLEELYLLAKGLGGTISGEHGIGYKRKRYLPLVMEKSEIEVMRRIKKALDPNNILNPGKIFDIEKNERTGI